MPRDEQASGRDVVHLPLLPLKDVVVFPRMVLPLLVGRPYSLAAVEDCLAAGKELFLCTQRDPNAETPGPKDLFPIGVFANILQTLRMPDGSMKVIVEGLARGKIKGYSDRQSFAEVDVTNVERPAPPTKDQQAIMRVTLGQFEEYVRGSQRIAPEIVATLRGISEADVLSDLICAHLPLRVEERQELLSILDANARLEQISTFLMRENDLLGLEHKVRERVREQMERSQREYYLHEQLKAIHQELGQREEGGDEYSQLRATIESACMPKDVHDKAMREFERYTRMPSMSPEAGVILTYIEWLCDMPWAKRTEDHLDLEVAKKVLDEDHYGLQKVKERILEYLAVRKLSKSTRGPILCLVGPPGVGKTSLGQSIARAMNRKFARVSLGGVRDEAEIRGHRRTYIGALPGRVIQSMKKVAVKNPVFMLDEIDKMSTDFRGDPSSALLEVLDPAQNTAFSDHYLEVDFDLHEIFFITTANNEFDIPHPLHDRMEIVRISGYTSFEKERIAQQFLVPKQMKECGLKAKHIKFTNDGILTIIRSYTREAGVRELERQIANVCRKVTKRVVNDEKTKKFNVDGKTVIQLLGREEFITPRLDPKPAVGVAQGLAWTMAGGDVLSIETSIVKGKGSLMLTGQLGDVMKESGQASFTYLRSRASELAIPENFYKANDVHVHVPEGAIPKDGPSAGITMAVSMLSALTNKAPRAHLAMTGEITLRGRVLPVGGIKEKVLAAHRAGLRIVMLPKENEKDIEDVPIEVKKEIEFHFVDNVKDVFKIAFPAIVKK
jgi:ATP-dependent Lon protease